MIETLSGTALPSVPVPPPGPRSRELAAELARWESPNVTYLADDFPVFWDEARGSNVRDVDGNVFLDLTSAFAVTGIGHGHPRVVSAIQTQAGRLLHGMGDVHPPAIKVDLLRALAEVAPGGLNRSILANSGAEAVEAALKTAVMATGKPRVLAFHGSYHGLTYRALSVSGREDFRAPFQAQLGSGTVFVPYPYAYRSPFDGDADAIGEQTLRYIRHVLDTPGTAHEGIGAILVEPIQARGGDIVPPDAFLPGLRQICDERGLLLILDEVYTGFGRTGKWFACEHWGVVPDLMLVGKGLTGGFPFAACTGTDAVMQAWPKSGGEAIHTSTFLGHPVGCAAALAAISVLRDEGLVERSAAVGERMRARLAEIGADHPHIGEVRGRGMMIGVEMVRDRTSRAPAPELSGRLMVEGLRRGLLLLGGGIHGNVLSLSPPFVMTDAQVDHALGAIEEILAGMR
ncbi:aminotransferase class III-fold pyridoxal phosphate-dependent enzyme [Longimicrobium terrae]|uniref:4-aminobutyrate aminotransferase n=1 Tax=Longimicrobium terrae TaxID=1639882 RepID=A0A841GXL4_9BACT|nr:4-aminobutyrate aminotransferase [Longimicrobium terrae]MBB6070489.1 4-aminobutyrate aminotransferase [Longimicrobium terrae]